MSRKQPKRRAGNMVFSAIAGIFILAVVCGVGLGVASADTSDDVARAGAFGFDEATQTATSAAHMQAASIDSNQDSYYEQSALAVASSRTIDAGLQMIDDKEEAERRRIAAEEEAERQRVAAEEEAERQRIAAENEAGIQRMQASQEMQGVASEPQEASVAYDLPAVDWSVGQEAFVQEWTARIDAYLAGSPLAGFGYAFAEAAWDNGVDPRWSPAISDTESSRGSVCFLPCNAWGWGQSSWGDWDSAIRAHVAGLASGYGYCITYQAAAAYCPPNTDYWYSHTIEQMTSI